MRPGDTDPDYFKDYTADQMAFAETAAEEVFLEAMNVLGEEAFD